MTVTKDRRPYTIFGVDSTAGLRAIKRTLSSRGFRVYGFVNGDSAIRRALKTPPSLFIMETALPQGDGLLLCDRIRRTAGLTTTPILFVSKRAQTADKVAGLEAGADDYVTKPFDDRELLARVVATLRRCYELSQSASYRFGKIEIDSNTMTLTVAGVQAKMSLSEFRLLDYLVRHPGRTFSREHLLKMIRSGFGEVKPRLVDVYVKSIRRKIEVDEENPQYLRTVRGVGYCFHLPDAPGSTSSR
jgi:DNA-binding response OmpR family regulator